MELLYFVLATGECNLQCRYCGGSFPKDTVGWDIEYDVEDLNRLVEGDRDATIAFYGGEPLLNAPFVERAMDTLRAKRFIIQTNGVASSKLHRRYWMRMDAVLVSLDGREEVTDLYRGEGVYAKALKAARNLRDMGYSGDLIARMAVSEHSDIYRDVLHLVNLKIFDHIHWQIDAGWSDSWMDFGGWAEQIYKPGILKLLDFWVAALRRGEVVGLVPFLGILKRINEGGPAPPCGSGSQSYSVLPNGRVLACPIAYDAPWADMGRLESLGKPLHRVGISGECLDCKQYRVCGGRCLYFNRERFWGDGGFRKVCDITRFTIEEIEKAKGRIMEALRTGGLHEAALDYPRYNNSTEIIP